jgi:Tol biopolymer transport system component
VEITVSHFHRLLGGIVAGLALLTLGLALGGDRTEPTALSVRPIDGEAEVSAARPIELRFGRPVSSEGLTPYLTIDPPTPGTLTVEDAVARFVPMGQLRPATRYTVTIRAGFQDLTGRALRRDQQLTFTTRPARLVLSRPEASTADVLAPRNLWVATAEGTELRPLVRNRLGILFVAISPDGDRVAYSTPSVEAPDASELWVANLDGTGRRKIAGDADGAILGLSWSPRGDVIAYERRLIIGTNGELGRPRILGVRADGGGAGLLYGRGDEAGSQPVWSPDGRRLLVADIDRGGRAIVDPAGGLVTVPGYGSDSGIWSPDGRLVAFADSDSPFGGPSSIRVADLDGRIVADLGRPGFSDSAPVWSPDGRSIAVVGRDEEGQSGIWLLDPNGGPARPVLASSADRPAQYTPPVWAPGTVSLAFSRLTNPVSGGSAGAGVPTAWELWAADGDGGNARRLPIDGLAEGWAP